MKHQYRHQPHSSWPLVGNIILTDGRVLDVHQDTDGELFMWDGSDSKQTYPAYIKDVLEERSDEDHRFEGWDRLTKDAIFAFWEKNQNRLRYGGSSVDDEDSDE